MKLQPIILSILRHVSRLLPRTLRSYLRRSPLRASLTKPIDLLDFRPRRNFSGRHVIVVGLLSSATGVGKAAILVARTLERQGIKTSLLDITPELGISPSRTSDKFLPLAAYREINASDIVVVLNPSWYQPLQLFDKKWLLERCIIAHWIWEIEAAPEFWRDAAISYDEIWTPTEFVEQSVRELLPNFPGLIRTVPYTIDFQLLNTPRSHDRLNVRVQLGIDPAAFVIGYSFACGSNYQRKNPQAAIDQFKAAFSNGELVVLILRCRDLNHHKRESIELRNKIANDPRILLFDDKISISIEGFYAAIDLYLSPSRAEGFGLNLVEASQMGIPVITSGWRLAPEIASLPHIYTVDYDLVPIADPQGTYSSIKGGRWSEPHLATVVSMLRLLEGEHRKQRPLPQHIIQT